MEDRSLRASVVGGETLSVVILSYNTKDITAKCIDSMLEHSPILADLEIIVIDNASSDSSADFIEKRFPSVKLIRNNRNRGFAAACNQGIRSSTGEFVLLLNSDTSFVDQSLDVLLDFMKNNEEVGVCGGVMVDSSGAVQYSCHNYPTYFNLLFSKAWLLSSLGVFKKRYEQYRGIPENNCDVDAIAGGFMLLRRRALSFVGLLDERFFFYVEDIDLSRRMRDAGWRVVIVPKAKVQHLGGASAKLKPIKTYAWHHRSLFRYFMKYYPYLLPLNLLLGLGLLGHLLISIVIKALRMEKTPC